MIYPNSTLQVIAALVFVSVAFYFFLGFFEIVFGFLDGNVYCARLLVLVAVLAATGGIVLFEKNRLMETAASREVVFNVAEAVRNQPEELLLAALLQKGTPPTYREVEEVFKAKWSRLEREKEEAKVAAMDSLRSRAKELLSEATLGQAQHRPAEQH